MDNPLIILMNILHWATTIIGVVSVILKVLEVIVKETESEKDDIKVAKARRVVDGILKVLHNIALSPADTKNKRK